MEWHPLELQDRRLIETALQENPLPLSDYSFTNLWMWNSARNYEIGLIDSFVCIRFQEQGQLLYLYPLGIGNRLSVIESMIQKSKRPFTMRAIPENSHLPYPLVPENDRFDYIYSFNDLLHLTGNAYQPKRNLIHQFVNTYSFAFLPIEQNTLPSIVQMENQWFIERQEQGAHNEHQASIRLLADFPHLSIFGGALVVENKIIAYAVAEYMNENTLLVHIQKALKEYKGAYQMMNQQLLAQVKPVDFVNFEEDLGLPNLHKMKHSYHPLRLEKKYLFKVF